MRIIIAYILLLYSPWVFAQSEKPCLIPFLNDNKYGFVSSNGKTIIDPVYDFAYPFLEDYELTLVIQKKKPILINRRGKGVYSIPLNFVKRALFNYGTGIIPENPPQISLEKKSTGDSVNGFKLLAKIDNLNLFDKIGNLYLISDTKKVFLIDDKGIIKSEKYDKIRHFPYGDFEYCITEDSVKQKKGMLDKNGKTLLKCTYDNIVYQGKGIFKITDGGNSHDFKVIIEQNKEEKINEKSHGNIQIKRKNGKAGVVDSSGMTIIPFEYERLYPLVGDRFIYLKKDSCGIIDTSQNALFRYKLNPDIFLTSSNRTILPYLPFTDSLIFFKTDYKWELVDIDGKRYNYSFDNIYVDYQKVISGKAGVGVDGKTGVIDKNAKLIIPAEYDEIICLSDNQSFIVSAEKNKTWLNSSGQFIYSGFEEYSYFIRDYLFVFKNGKWYFVDINGREFYK